MRNFFTFFLIPFSELASHNDRAGESFRSSSSAVHLRQDGLLRARSDLMSKQQEDLRARREAAVARGESMAQGVVEEAGATDESVRKVSRPLLRSV